MGEIEDNQSIKVDISDIYHLDRYLQDESRQAELGIRSMGEGN